MSASSPHVSAADFSVSNRGGAVNVGGSMTLASMLGSTTMGFGTSHGAQGSTTTLHSTFTPPSMAAAAAMIGATGVDPHQVSPQMNPMLMLHGFNAQAIQLLTQPRHTHVLPLVLLTPQAISAAAVVGGVIAAKIASDGTAKALDARNRQSGAAAAASGMPDPDSDDEGEEKRHEWNSWRNLPKETHEGKEYARIGDRLYSQHAVDRMQPSGLGTPAGQLGEGRSIAPRFVEDAIKTGVRRIEIQNGVEQSVIRSGNVEVITEQMDRVIVTVKYVRL
jgi:hypothetical protein